MEENEQIENVESSNETVERESNEDIIIEIPFNPNKIKVKSFSYSVGQIIQDIEDGVVNLDTEFQRLPNLWNNTKKSHFIESLLLNLPIPSFYFNERNENYWEVIDGLQRISTLKSFVIDGTLVLNELDFLKELNGKTFKSLPNSFQKRITRFAITVYLIEKGTPNEVKYHIFMRVNKAGLTLTPQEIRHAMNQGLPSELVADLARGKDNLLEDGSLKKRKNESGEIIELRATEEGRAFVRATDYKIPTIRMNDRDFVNRFIAFYLTPYQDYQPDLDSFLSRGMEKIKDLNQEQILILKRNFTTSMNLAYFIFGEDAFRKRFAENDSRKPINKALFEVISVIFAKLTEEQTHVLRDKANLFRTKLIDLNNNNSFYRSITQGTAKRESVIQRFTDIQRIIRETIENDNSITNN